MASVNIGTTTTQYSIPRGRRNIVKASNGTLLLVARTSAGVIEYKKSSDNGVNWDGSWTTIEGSLGNTSSYGFDILIDDSDNVYVMWANSSTKNIYLRKLTYVSGTTWTVGDIKTVTTTDAQHPTLIKRASGQLFVTFGKIATGVNDLYAAWSDDDGDTWDESFLNITTGYKNFSDINSIEVGDTVWGIYKYSSGDLEYCIWNNVGETWGNPQTIGSITPYTGYLAVGKVSDNEIYVAADSTSGIEVFKYTGTWDSGTLLSNGSTDIRPAVSIVGDKPVVSWTDYDGSDYNIAYRVWDGEAWESQVDLALDVGTNKYCTTMKSDTSTLYSCWYSGTSPYPIYFEAVIFSTEVLSDINNDFRFVKNYAYADFDNDFRMVSSLIRADINNDFRISGAELDDIDNDFRMVGTFVRDDINNDFRMIETPPTITVTDDVYNLFNMVGSILNDVTNDIRTQKEELNNITNDFRMIASFQIPGDAGFQSLGKEYIKIYIDSVEQTDVDVNSVNIAKELNISHTASFDLGRAYDGTKPDTKATVEIKYNEWTIYKGYIVNISPADSPESIRINCNDKYWLRNRTKKYFHVGHKPQDNQELYYNTPKEALSTECDLSVNIGNFIPQTIDCFAQGESDCISTLLQESGNYGWFYKEDETKKLWEGGKGSIINISPQTLGTNINLHQIIRHQFKDDISGIVNKFRVQMGEKITRTYDEDGGTKTYTGYNYSNGRYFPQPDWNGTFENAYGEEASDDIWEGKEDVYTKYTLPYLNPELSSWTDRYPPKVELFKPGSFPYGFPSGEMTEGFTIDFENKTLRFSEPLFLYMTDSDGNVIAYRRPNITLLLWKKDYYSYTSSPSEDPEEAVSNPLMFFTDKMGSYSETIINNLNLSGLSIQEGLVYDDDDGNEVVVPSWDDTEFAKDYANWQLSKICDEKISGSIDITLDTFLFYGIDLSNRIMIDGVIDSPLNITSITINTSTFIVTLKLETIRNYQRTVSLQSRGE